MSLLEVRERGGVHGGFDQPSGRKADQGDVDWGIQGVGVIKGVDVGVRAKRSLVVQPIVDN